MKIRAAHSTDKEAIRRVHMNAFSIEENELVAQLSVQLLEEQVQPPIISLVAEHEKKIVAHIAFSPCKSDQTDASMIYALAPLGVSPEHQRMGTGSALIKTGIETLRNKGVHTILVYGDPNYYDRFGFNTLVAKRFIPPYKLTYPHGWLGMTLEDGPPSEQKILLSCVRSLQNEKLW